MKWQKTGWLVILAMSATTVASAQSSSGTPFSAIRDSGNRARLSLVESPQLPTSEAWLPDAPSTTAEKLSSQDTAAPTTPAEQPMPRSPRPMTNGTLGPTFLIANGVLLGSTIANVGMIANCRPSSCQAVPSSIRNRGALYGIGIPSSLAISYISYRLKRGGTKFWIVPVAAFTAGNIAYAIHASQWGR